MPYLLITALALTGLVTAIVIKSRSKRRQHAEREDRKPIIDWINRVQNDLWYKNLAAINDEEIPDTSRWSDLGEKVTQLRKRIKEAREKVAAELEEKRHLRGTAKTAFDRMNATEEVVERFELAREIHNGGTWNNLTEEDQNAVTDYLRENLDTYVEILLEEARSDNRSSFVALDVFTREAISHSQYWRFSDQEYDTPEDWDNLVVQFYQVPALDDFRFVNTDQQPEQVRHLAGKALKERSLRKAQVVLAFSNKTKRYSTGRLTDETHWPWRDALGAVLLAELTKMVEELQANNNCVFSSETSEA